jgi:hypothetical protein
VITTQVTGELDFSVQSPPAKAGHDGAVISGRLRADGSDLVVSTSDPAGLARAVRADLGNGQGPFALVRRLRVYSAALAEQGLVLRVEGRRGTLIEIGRIGESGPPAARRRAHHLRVGAFRTGWAGALIGVLAPRLTQRITDRPRLSSLGQRGRKR